MKNSFTKCLRIGKSKLRGKLCIPPSKSQTQRALLFALMGKGVSTIYSPLNSPDCEAMEKAIQTLGAKIEKCENFTRVQGGLREGSWFVDAGNSGQVLRFVGALSSLLSSPVILTGDRSLQENRPISPLLSALQQLGAKTKSLSKEGFAPFSVQGPIRPGTCWIEGQDSQPVSGVLIATSFLNDSSEIFVKDLGEMPWIQLTIDWIRRLGGRVEQPNAYHFHVLGGLSYKGFDYQVPGDFSTAAFPIVAALVTQSSIAIEGLDKTDCQGDKEIIPILQKMGAQIFWTDSTLWIEPSELQGCKIDVNPLIDALPILAVAACFAKGETLLYNGEIARKKESDRIHCISRELRKMGACIEEFPDGCRIQPSQLKGCSVESHQDHRIALSLAVAGMNAQGVTQICGMDCIEKSYPVFIQDFQQIGAEFELDFIRI